MTRISNINMTPGGGGGARIRANSAAAAKAVAPKKPKGPVKVLTPIKGSGTVKSTSKASRVARDNTNPKPVVVKPKKIANPNTRTTSTRAKYNLPTIKKPTK
jgi:hypothetical protein